MTYPNIVPQRGVAGDTIYLKSNSQGYVFVLNDEAGLPLDATGSTITAEIDISGTNPVGEVVWLSITNGRFQVKFNKDQTTGITPDTYPYRVKAELEDGEVFTLTKGNIKIEGALS